MNMILITVLFGKVVYLPCSKAAPVSLLPEAHPAPEGDLQERVYNSKRTAERWAQFYMGEYLTAVPRARNIQVRERGPGEQREGREVEGSSEGTETY